MDLRQERIQKRRPLLVAHRGVCGGNIPCNTRESFLAAILQGADVVELDVSLSRDGKLYVQHPGMEAVQTDSEGPFSEKDSSEIDKIRHLNADLNVTAYPLISLEDALLLLRGKCRVNIDKFWIAPKEISALVHELHMEDDVIVKARPTEEVIRILEECARDIPFMALISGEDIWSDLLRRNPNITYVGTELLFDETAEDDVEAYIAGMHEKGLAVWVNAIVYNYRTVLAAGHTDDAAVTGDPDGSWGWLMDRGFDLVQTDFLLACRLYYDTRKDRIRAAQDGLRST